MAIKDLKVKEGNVNLTLTIVDKGPVREFNKFGKSGKVCNAQAKDESGTISLTLWNDDIDKVKAGDVIQLTNGYVGEWQGEPQLSTGRFGKIEVTGSDASAARPAAKPEKPAAKPAIEDNDIDVDEDFIE